MERVKADGNKLNMWSWQTTGGWIEETWSEEDIKTTYKEFDHNCGTACCFAGWVAVSPEFHDDGGSCSVNSGGEPELFLDGYEDHSKYIASGRVAMKFWLEITSRQSASLCGLSRISNAYPRCKDVENIEIDDVLKALHSLHDTGKLPGELDERQV